MTFLRRMYRSIYKNVIISIDLPAKLCVGLTFVDFPVSVYNHRGHTPAKRCLMHPRDPWYQATHGLIMDPYSPFCQTTDCIMM